ncbi:MAG: hypothetical protein J2P25_16060 [Nocardiopsaceae bacterium]|nr:hypothetical protein [Nocardiopsaceae bacterium]
MSLQITATEMTSSQTRHAAAAKDGAWMVSWLPGRVLSQSEAVTAMTIAEAAATCALSPGDPMRAHVGVWAAELGMTADAAIDAVAAAGRGEPR